MSSPDVAKREADLVMKGGITSGVIYPRLVERLANVYTLRSIGGTSAGAIAAGAAAAAQLGVTTGSNPTAFERLGKLPTELGGSPAPGGPSMLLSLFQPQAPLQPVFDLLLLCLRKLSPMQLALQLSWALVRHHPGGALLGVLPGLLVLMGSHGVAWFIGLVLSVVGAVLAAAISGVLAFGRELPQNGFGLCNGLPPAGSSRPALTPWLGNYFRELAGKTDPSPLTFGELWDGKLRDAASRRVPRDPNAPPGKVIELAVMTTAVSMGRPFRLPFESRNVFFDPADLAKYFPVDVVQWMIDHARKSATAERVKTPTLYALPEAEDFPVIVAVRMSLSFPILLSAVPLYTIDWTLDANRKARDDTPLTATRVLFSDGGISSNFPIHFFDSPLPSRPTFGVNLTDFPKDMQGLPPKDLEEQRVSLPDKIKNTEGILSYCPELSEAPGLGSIAGFLAAIVDTMQSWRDEAQLGMPGFRDRIANIRHQPSEGGMNLNMDAAVIKTLADSGEKAANRFIEVFATGGRPGAANGWDNHQRIRLRTLLAEVQGAVMQIDHVMASGRSPYFAIADDEQPPSYGYTAVNRAAAITVLQSLQGIAATLREAQADLDLDAPRPEPELRIVPRM